MCALCECENRVHDLLRGPVTARMTLHSMDSVMGKCDTLTMIEDDDADDDESSPIYCYLLFFFFASFIAANAFGNAVECLGV